MKLDLASLESTKNFIENFKQKNLPLHLLICNAGIALVPYGENGIYTDIQQATIYVRTQVKHRTILKCIFRLAVVQCMFTSDFYNHSYITS